MTYKEIRNNKTNYSTSVHIIVFITFVISNADETKHLQVPICIIMILISSPSCATLLDGRMYI